MGDNITSVNSESKPQILEAFVYKYTDISNGHSSITNGLDEYNDNCKFKKRGGFRKRLKKLKFKRMIDGIKTKANMERETFISNTFPTSHSDRQPITKKDVDFKKILDHMENIVNRAARKRNNSLLTQAISSYQNIAAKDGYPPRMLLQMAEAMALAFHFNNSMVILRQSVDTFKKFLLTSDEVSNDLFHYAGSKSVNLLRRLSLNAEAISIQKLIYKRFPGNTSVINTIGSIYLDQAGPWKGIYSDIAYLLKAKYAFNRALRINPDDVYAKVNLGYISYYEIFNNRPRHTNMTEDCWKRLKEAANLILSGIQTEDPDFRFHLRFIVYVLGDAMRKIKNIELADQLFEFAAKTNLFCSFWRRSGFYLTDIRSMPIWKLNETKIGCLLKEIRGQWKSIRIEALGIYERNLYKVQNENIKDTGNWEVYNLYNSGKRFDENCVEAPITCNLFEELPQIANNRRGSVSFSLMHSGTHVFPHSGPTNTRLRAHLGLDIPWDNTSIPAVSASRLRVQNEYLSWQNGELLILTILLITKYGILINKIILDLFSCLICGIRIL